MLKRTLKCCISLSLLALSACATIPAARPSAMVAPAPGKPFELFKEEDASCRHWAEQQTGGLSSQEVFNNNTATGAVTGAAVGAGLGALMGSASGHAGAGALIGGVSGLLLGAVSGADSARVYGRQNQRRYDIAYIQCMYANGNQILGNGRDVKRYYRAKAVPPPPMPDQPPSYESIPPPPPGTSPQIHPDIISQPFSGTLPSSDRAITPPEAIFMKPPEKPDTKGATQ